VEVEGEWGSESESRGGIGVNGETGHCGEKKKGEEGGCGYGCG